MYVVVNKELGHVLQAEEVFSDACERCLKGTIEEHDTFLEIATHSEDMENFAETLIEWFYSGNWVKEVGHA